MSGQKKIKILQVVGAMNRAGTETMLMNIYRHMDRNKFQFDFISYDTNEAHYDKEIESLNGRVIRLTKTNSVKQIYDAIKKYGPYDVVHAHTLFHSGIANLAAFFAGIKIRIAHAHTTSDKGDSFQRKAYINIMRLIINTFSTHLLACSEQSGHYLFGRKHMMKGNYAFFPNVIDYSSFLNTRDIDVKKFKLNEGLGNNHIVIGHIGTFKESKNQSFLIDIMATFIEKNRKVNLLLVGDGELKQSIQADVHQKGLTNYVKFLGIRSNISTILHSMDVFVFPSIYEGLGLVLLEAQASGIPCVVSEAIQPEADLGLGLVNKIPLDAGPHVWTEKIVQLATKRETNKQKIIERFEKSGYSITEGIQSLMKLYSSTPEGLYEQSSNRLL